LLLFPEFIFLFPKLFVMSYYRILLSLFLQISVFARTPFTKNFRSVVVCN